MRRGRIRIAALLGALAALACCTSSQEPHRGEPVASSGRSLEPSSSLFGWVPLYPPAHPPPRIGAAMVYDSLRQRVVLFGGTYVFQGSVPHTTVFDGIERATCAGFVGASVACRAASCADGVKTLAASCDNRGACLALQQNRARPTRVGRKIA